MGLPKLHSEDHVLATTSGLDSNIHTVSGLTARQVLIASSATDAQFRAIEEADLPLTYASEVTFNGGIDLGTSGVVQSQVADGASAKAFNLQDTISRTQGDTVHIENTALGRVLMRATWDGRFSFGYTATTTPQTGHVLSFLQVDSSSPTGAPHNVGILGWVGHDDTAESPDRLYGVVGSAIALTATGLGNDLIAGLVGTAGCDDNTTGLSAKSLVGVLGFCVQNGSLAQVEPTTLWTNNLQLNLNTSGVPAGDWGYCFGFFAPHIYSSAAKGAPSNRPDVVAGVGSCIPGWSATTGEQWAFYGFAENPSGSVTPAVGGGMYLPFPARGTRKTHIHLVPYASPTGGPTGAATGDIYFDDGTNNTIGLYEYHSGAWNKL